MKIIAVLKADESTTIRDLYFQGGFTPHELARRLKSLPEIDDVVLALPDGCTVEDPGSLRIVGLGSGTELDFWKGLFEDGVLDHAIHVHADSPFLDTDIIKEMLAVHLKYLPEYTYSENVPAGFCGEIISSDLVKSLPENEKNTLPLSQVIKSNIHHFDVEIHYAHPDIREKRLSFRSTDPRDRIVMENISEKLGRVPSYSEIKDVIEGSPGVLFISPSFIEVELTGRCDLNCIFCYRNSLKNVHGDMDPSVYRRLIEGIEALPLPCSLFFSGSGEPLMHDKFYELMDLALGCESVSSLVLETNGILADGNFANYLSAHKVGKLKVIVNINGLDRETYTALHGTDHFDTVSANIETLRKSLGEGALYVQIMKINETEQYLDEYYDFWEKKGVPIILQKQNTYLGRIQDRRYSDLSPIDRIPCWHLQRDLYVLSDGTVTFCKQDVDGASTRGSIESASLPDIYRSALNDFINDYRGKLAGKPDCASCDEWYTFNR